MNDATKVIIKLVISFLQEYREVLYNDCCNDWTIPNTFTKEEANIIHTLMYDFDEREGDYSIFENHQVVSMLVSKLKSGLVK